MHTVVVVRPGDEVAGRYRLEQLQGHGPMSEVWRAHDSTLDRTIALKILSPTADLGRFRREAQALAALAHENVMRVYDYGEAEAGPFMALEWLHGGTLEERLREGPLPDGETSRIAEGIATGLSQLKLGDFGLARRVAGAGTLTEAGTVLGTAAYLSPEQAAAEPVGPASDVYSFGVILFRMLTGALPFVADEALALLNMHRYAAPPAVAELRPDAPPDLAALAEAALRKDPAQRPADGNALLAALSGEAPTMLIAPADTAVTRVIPAPPPEGPEPRRFWREPAVIAAIVILLALGGGLLAWAVTRTDNPAPPGPSTAAHGTHTHTTPTTPTTQPSPPTTSTGGQGTTTTAPHTTVPTTTLVPPTTVTTPTITAPTTTIGITTATTPTTTSGSGTTTGTP